MYLHVRVALIKSIIMCDHAKLDGLGSAAWSGSGFGPEFTVTESGDTESHKRWETL